MTIETMTRTEDGMDSPIETDEIIKKWKKVIFDSVHLYAMTPEEDKYIFDFYHISLMLGMLENLNAHSTGKSHID